MRAESRPRSRFKSTIGVGGKARARVDSSQYRTDFVIKGDVESGGRVGQGTDADAINTGAGQHGYAFKIDSSRSFELDGRSHGVATTNGDSQRLRAEIVDQNDIRSATQRAFKLFERINLDFNDGPGRSTGACRPDRRRDRAWDPPSPSPIAARPGDCP